MIGCQHVAASVTENQLKMWDSFVVARPLRQLNNSSQTPTSACHSELSLNALLNQLCCEYRASATWSELQYKESCQFHARETCGKCMSPILRWRTTA